MHSIQEDVLKEALSGRWILAVARVEKWVHMTSNVCRRPRYFTKSHLVPNLGVGAGISRPSAPPSPLPEQAPPLHLAHRPLSAGSASAASWPIHTAAAGSPSRSSLGHICKKKALLWHLPVREAGFVGRITTRGHAERAVAGIPASDALASGAQVCLHPARSSPRPAGVCAGAPFVLGPVAPPCPPPPHSLRPLRSAVAFAAPPPRR